MQQMAHWMVSQIAQCSVTAALTAQTIVDPKARLMGQLTERAIRRRTAQ
jgi:hypothetical protein